MSWEDEDTVIPNIVANPFAGVDEDANVPDSWDAEIEEPLKKQPEEVKKVEIKPKLVKKEKLKKKQEGDLPVTELDREILAKDIEYEIFKDSFACNNKTNSIVNGIDDIQVQTKEDFEKLKELLKKKILPLEKNPNYSMFLENTFRDLVISSDVETLKKFSVMFSALANEKSKVQKNTGKKKKAIKGAKLATVRVNDVTNYEDDDDLEFDEDY